MKMHWLQEKSNTSLIFRWVMAIRTMSVGLTTSVSKEIMQITESMLGQKMFGFTACCIASESIAAFIEEKMLGLQSLGKVTSMAVDELVKS